MKNCISALSACIALLTVAGCSATHTDNELVSGKWRGEFVVNDTRIPFTFTVQDSAGHAKVYLTNGAEKAALDSVYYKGDSVVIGIQLYDAILVSKISGDSLPAISARTRLRVKVWPLCGASEPAALR